MARYNTSYRWIRSNLNGVFLFFVLHAAAAAEIDYQEILLAVRLSGELVAENALILERDDGALYALVSDLNAWRLEVPPQSTIVYEGEVYAPLDTLPGTVYTIELSTLELHVDIPATYFRKTLLFQRPPRIPPQGSRGVYANYDFLLTAGDGQESDLGGVFELVAFDAESIGVFKNTALGQQLNRDGRFTRLETTWTKDLVDRRESITIGDSFTSATALSRPIRYAGIKWATNFDVDPTFVQFPVNVIGGLAEQESLIDVYVDGSLRAKMRVPRGPFEIESLPSISGEGEVTLVVADLLGREQRISQQYYFSAENLTKGVSDFSYQLGFERQNFGIVSSDYGDGFLSATHRYGFTDRATAEGHLEISHELRGAGAAGVLLVPGFGRLSPGLFVSNGVEGTGYNVTLTYDRARPRTNFALGAEYASPEAARLGQDLRLPRPRMTTRALFSMNLRGGGNIGFSYVRQNYRDREDQAFFNANYRISLDFGTLSVSAFKTIEPYSASTVSAQIVVPFGDTQSVIGSLTKQDAMTRETVEYQKNLGASERGISYRLSSERDALADRFNGNFVARTGTNRLTLDTSIINDVDTYRFGLAGAVALMGSSLHWSQPINNSFAVVSTGGIEGITVYNDNRDVGKTGRNGRLLVPSLGSYRINQLSLEPNDIPLDAVVSRIRESAVPYSRSGLMIDFPVSLSRGATVRVLDSSGEPLPAGTQLRSTDGSSSGQIARDGLAYITGLGIGEIEFLAEVPNAECRFVIEISENFELLPYLGETICLVE